jgi:N-acetylglucosamine kinase-like BadF-type ATPase
LTQAFLERLQLRQPQELVSAIYRGGWDRTALADLAPLVFAQADAGDAGAKRIRNEGAEHLAAMMAAVVRQLGMAGKVPLALAGGCLLASATFQQDVVLAMARLAVDAVSVKTVPEPALGALHLAKMAAPYGA